MRNLSHEGGDPGDLFYIDANGVRVPLSLPADWAAHDPGYYLGISGGFPAWMLLDGTAVQLVSLPTIASGVTLYPPAFIGDTALALPTIASTVTLYAPTVGFEQSLSLPTIASGSTLFAPTLEATVEPDDIANLVVWLKSDTGVYSDAGTTPAVADDPVQQWNDQSGSGNHFTQATLANRPLYKTAVVNSLPALRYDATNDSLSSTLTRGLGGTYFIVYCHNGAGSANRRGLVGGNNWLIGPYGGQHSFYGGGGFVANTDAPVTQNVFVAATARQSTSAGADGKFWVNAVDKTDTPANSTGGPGANFGTGAANPFVEPLDGDIAEVIAYSRELSDGEVDDVHAYLQTRYGLW
jgi:hypothetical protein